ncbi:MAG TPA: hypothetical protein VFZ15_10560 [Acidimicrobiia bacterium]|nr:hypothetical protein [Acidimicrobiia bacterium]
MRQMRLATGIILLLAGTVWTLQGLDASFAPKSFMSGDRAWVWFGILAVVGGGALAWSARPR